MEDHIKCELHQNQYVNNFCRRKECMVGLCATCICDHTLFHHQRHTLPDYQNINTTYQTTTQMINQYQQIIKREKTKISQLSENLTHRNKNFWELFQKGKKECLQMVEKYFNQLQTHFVQKIKEEQIKTGLHSEQKLRQIEEQINIYEEKLQEYDLRLQNTKAPSLIKEIHSQILPNTNKIVEEVSEELSKNYFFKPNLLYYSALFPDIRNTIKKMFVLEFSYPQKIVGHVPRQSCINILTQVRNGNSIPRSKAKPMSIGRTTGQIVNMSRSKIAQPLNKSRIVFNNTNSSLWLKDKNSNIVKSSLRPTVPMGNFLSTF